MPAPLRSAPVLVAIDGTESGLDALALGRTLAALMQAPLVLGAVHGYEPLASLFGGPGWPGPEESWEWLRRASREPGRDARCRLVTIGADSVAHGLAALARREGAAVIAIGTSERGAAGRLRAGTGARRVLHAAGCPVAIAPPGWRGRPLGAQLVFGVGADGEAALQWGRALAAAAGATLRMLQGDPAARVAAGAGPDLLIVGSYRHATTACPLLIVPAGTPPPGLRPPTLAAARG